MLTAFIPLLNVSNTFFKEAEILVDSTALSTSCSPSNLKWYLIDVKLGTDATDQVDAGIKLEETSDVKFNLSHPLNTFWGTLSVLNLKLYSLSWKLLFDCIKPFLDQRK